jgi:copper(I)-binding protein
MEQFALFGRDGMSGIWARAALAASCAVLAAAAQAQPASVKDAWVRAPAPGQKVAGVYMEIVGRTHSALVAVASPVAARAELHSMALEDGVMKMRPLERIELPAGQTVKLAPGGLHAMLIDLKQPLQRGEKVPLTLTVLQLDSGSRSVFTVRAEVRDADAKGHHH